MYLLDCCFVVMVSLVEHTAAILYCNVYTVLNSVFNITDELVVPSGTKVMDLWLSVLCMCSKAWLAAPVLLARAEVTKNILFFNGSKT